jgi:hypothetical protein
MSPTIEVSTQVHSRLKELAGPLFSPSEVIERLLGLDSGKAVRASASSTTIAPEAGSGTSAGLAPRSPRERGISVQIDDTRINAVSVRDLYLQFLQYMVNKKLIARIEQAIPYRTSNQRFLIAKKPTHPNGNSFVVPVGFGGYFMEAHKNYENAMSGLQQLAKIGGFSIREAD